MPTPSLAFCTDCVRAVTLACKPLAIANPAASSAPLLMRWPVESCCRVLLRLVAVMFNEFCACSEEILFRMLKDILKISLVRIPPASRVSALYDSSKVENRPFEQEVNFAGYLSAPLLFRPAL